MKIIFITLLAVTPLFSTAWAGEARSQLDAFHQQVKTLQADFEQRLVSEKGEVRQHAFGKVYIQRPGQFRWNYHAPYEQMIMADHHKLTLYDVDLEQVTIKKIDDAFGQTPAVVLSGAGDLDESFNIIELEPHDGMQWVALLPRNKEGSFVRMQLGFLEGELSVMMLQDSFNQLTTITLSNVVRNKPLPAAIFEFEVPEGVDVVGDLD
ncbi:MAG: outer membrane lipoprotein chaperone LolA [Gammaproteobacteria bacterium]|nr:outer membrane lipoprotein chaperone LolA [Gammaproteobacteria bacterium]MCF6229530.1 outer membrane lipoprotein chaperone LolA [Gammaproteobacteria bacterium]